MLAAIIPVKSLRFAKSRLAGLLTEDERRALVLAMFEDVLAALRAARAVDSVGVISVDSAVLARAAALGAEALVDRPAELNGSLAQAARYYAARGAESTLVVHADVPLATGAEIDALVASLGDARGVVLAGARDGGTNALLARPPLALPFMFGHGSLSRHLAAARERDLPARLFRGHGLALDVDRPDDLLLLAELEGHTATQRLARELSVAERVMCV